MGSKWRIEAFTILYSLSDLLSSNVFNEYIKFCFSTGIPNFSLIIFLIFSILVEGLVLMLIWLKFNGLIKMHMLFSSFEPDNDNNEELFLLNNWLGGALSFNLKLSINDFYLSNDDVISWITELLFIL